MNKNTDRNASGKVLCIVGAGIVIFMLAVLFFALVFPMLSAKSKMKDVSKCFEGVIAGDVMIITDPLYRKDGSPGEVTVFPAEEDISEISNSIYQITKSAKYIDTESALSGCWDICVSVGNDKESFRIYLADESFYVADAEKKYVFEADDIERYSELCLKIENMLAEGLKK